mmetsp:Transcript_135/g.380  ORF Transcript_135/g.380 Transcript_135/m.380 type:complete len:220 (-) Transcript_135:251-910(-)
MAAAAPVYQQQQQTVTALPTTTSGKPGESWESHEYDWVIEKLRGRGFATLQDRRAEAEAQRKARLAAWEAEKAARAAAGEDTSAMTRADGKPSWWGELKALPGAARDEKETPEHLLSEEQLEEKRLRDKWGGTLAESVPISDLKTISEKGYIPRSQSTCFRCGQKGHWSRDCPLAQKNRFKEEGDILSKDRNNLRGRDVRRYDKANLDQQERAHYGRYD